MTSARAFYGVSALLFVISVAVTVLWCASMSSMGGMAMPVWESTARTAVQA